MNRISATRKGFTIVELLIVVVVIAILAAITIVAYNGITNRAKESTSQNAAAQAARKIAAYAVDNADTYPQDKAAFLAYANLQDGAGTSSAPGYQYSVSSDRKNYCLTTTTNSLSYYTNAATQTPTKGACPGQGLNGGPVITNLAFNPSFEAGISDVNTFTAFSSNPTSGGYAGSRYLRVTPAVAGGASWGPWWDAAAVEAGKTYRISFYARSNVGAARNMRVEWRDSSGSQVSAAIITTVTVGTSWQQVTGTSTAPSGAVTARLTFYTQGSAGSTSENLDVDAVMITEGTTQYVFADGSSNNWVWTGAQNSSTSSGPPL